MAPAVGSMCAGAPPGLPFRDQDGDALMTDTPRVAVIGLDCGTPQLLFRDFEAETPNIHALMQRGMWGDLASITPPITVPAWACAMTGKTPGQLGIYGFRNRKDTSYDGLSIATADADQGARGLGRARGQGPSIAPDRCSTIVPAPEGVPRMAGRVLPHAALRQVLGLPGRARDRDRRRARRGQRLHLRHPGLPSGRLRRRARPGLQDDRAPLPGRAQAGGREAVGLLHAVRDRAGSPPPRVLAALGSHGIRCTRPGTSTRRRSRTTTGSWTSRSASSSRSCRTTRSRS